MSKYRLCQYVLICALSCCCLLGKAQYVLEGQVLDIRKVPIPNASIKIKDSAKGLPRFFAISNAEGLYRVSLPVNSKNYWLECSLLGYRNVLFAIPNLSGNKLVQNISLIADSTALPEIYVYSIPPVIVSGDTTTFRIDAFIKGNESNVGDLLNALPGFLVTNGRISYNGKAVSKVLIEDDDLFGSDYNTITQNLSPKGIEKIQLIENYNDKIYLTNRLKKGDELVVNIKFNKKHLYRIITSNEIGHSFSPISDFYKIRQNIVSLVPKIKSVTTTNFNNTGLLATEILGTQVNLPDIGINKKDAINFDFSSRFSTNTNSQLPDISSAIVPKNKMAINHSSIITNNSLYKASKKLQLKSIVQYYKDVFTQQQSETSDYAVSGINLLVQNKQFLQKKVPVVKGAIESIYSPSTNTQLIYKASINSQNETDSLNDIRQLVGTYTKNKGQSYQFQQQVGFSFSLDSNRIIDIRLFHKKASSNQLPVIFPSILYTVFTADTIFDEIHSSIHNKVSEYIFQTKFTRFKKRANWSLEFLHNTSHSNEKSGITLSKSDSARSILDAQLLNDNALKTRISSAVFTYNTSISNSLSFRSTHRIESGQLEFGNDTLFARKTYTHYLPTFNLGFSITKKSRLDFNADFRNKLPQIYNLTKNYIFQSGNNISQGISNIQMGISKSISLSYSYTEMIKQKLILAASLYYTKDPILYLTNSSPSAFYTVSNSIVSGKNLNLLGLTAFASKYISSIKSQVGAELSVNKIASFYSINNQTSTADLSAIASTFKIKTLVTNQLISNLSTKAIFNMQRIDKNMLTERRNKSTTLINTAELIYRVNSKWVLNIKYQHLHQILNTQTHSIQFSEAIVKYLLIKNKLNLMLSGNNLFTNGDFSYVVFTQNSINTQTIVLLRPFWMLHAVIEL